MTNPQQLQLEPAADQQPQQPQEEVQLTELKPVEHSRITAERGDCDATDGLKALRSFSRRLHVDEFQQFGASFPPRKRKAQRWRQHLRDAVEFRLEDDEDEDEDDATQCSKRRPSARGLDGSLEDGQNSDEDDDEDEEEEEFGANGEDYYGVNGDFDYLEDKNNEIYVYRRQCSSPEVEEEEEEREPEVPENDAPKAKLPVEEAAEPKPQPSTPAKRPRGRPRKKKFPRNRKNNAAPGKEAAESPADCCSEQSEKELRNKINDIIEANMLLEQENNNVVASEKPREVREERNDEEDKEEEQRQEQQLQQEQQQPKKKYSCDLCDARFKGSGGLRNHYKVVHSSGPLFRCDECGKEFPLKERLKLHVRTHTGFKPYKCPECDKSFARGGQLVQHRRTHSQVKPYSCELCSGTFTCAANLALHVKRHNGQKDHKCELCGRGFVRRDALKKHLECLHRDVKSFLCVICNKTFKGHLPQHMRTHARDRPHGCATCGQRFAQKSQLTVHQRTHSGQRPFRCLVCWQAFAHSTALKLHTRRHTGERPFKCAECNAGFTQLPHWKKHMKCIHGRSEPYRCRGCNSFFRIKSELENHEKDCQAAAASEPSPATEGSSNEDRSSAGVATAAAPVAEPGGIGPAELSEASKTLARYRNMSIEKMRLLLAVLLKRISKPERLDELGFGKRLIDDVLADSLLSAGKSAVRARPELPEFEALRENLAVFLEWTVPKEHWDKFRMMSKSPEDVLETLTAT